MQMFNDEVKKDTDKFKENIFEISSEFSKYVNDMFLKYLKNGLILNESKFKNGFKIDIKNDSLINAINNQITKNQKSLEDQLKKYNEKQFISHIPFELENSQKYIDSLYNINYKKYLKLIEEFGRV